MKILLAAQILSFIQIWAAWCALKIAAYQEQQRVDKIQKLLKRTETIETWSSYAYTFNKRRNLQRLARTNSNGRKRLRP